MMNQATTKGCRGHHLIHRYSNLLVIEEHHHPPPHSNSADFAVRRSSSVASFYSRSNIRAWKHTAKCFQDILSYRMYKVQVHWALPTQTGRLEDQRFLPPI